MTDLDTNRENLSKLLTFLKERIFSRTENRWFSEALLAELSPSCSDKISDIYEQCIESILTEQANEFYKDFVIDELRPQLIRDFIKMEHWRRRNDIGEFGMALYQQIECVINYISNDPIMESVYRSLMNAPAFVLFEAKSIFERYIAPPTKHTTTIKEFIFEGDKHNSSAKTLAEQGAYMKFKCINFFICRQAFMSPNPQFKVDNNMFSNIYALRNTNHRGNIINEYDSRQIDTINENHSRTFLTFTAFLAWFIDQVNKGWPLSENLIKLAEIDFSSIDYTRLS